VTVANLGTTTSAGWTLTVTFANGQSISQSWGGQRSGSSPTYTFVNEPYNGVLAPNGSTTVGFIASWNGSNTAPTVSCALR
jgi:xyloglucan-specific exo-beta-1,4-glucanase